MSAAGWEKAVSQGELATYRPGQTALHPELAATHTQSDSPALADVILNRTQKLQLLRSKLCRTLKS